MALQLVLFDLEHTLVASDGALAPGIEGLLRFLARHKIRFGAVSARPRRDGEEVLARHRLSPAAVLAREDLAAEPGRLDVYHKACERAACGPDEAVYVGQAAFDPRQVLQAMPLFFNPAWAGTETGYGWRMETPRHLEVFIDLYLRKQHPWHVTVEIPPPSPLRVHALVDGRAGGKSPLKELLLETLKYRKPVEEGRLNQFLRHHLLASLYLSGLHRQVDRWTIVPGHVTRSANPFLDAAFVKGLPNLLERFLPDLLIRHRDAEPHFAIPRAGGARSFSSQLTTMHLNPHDLDQIRDRTVLVVDDFIGDGHSAEWARNALLRAGARAVLVCAVAKFGEGYEARQLAPGRAWDPAKPDPPGEDEFTAAPQRVRYDRTALAELADSYKRWAAGVWREAG